MERKPKLMAYIEETFLFGPVFGQKPLWPLYTRQKFYMETERCRKMRVYKG